MEVLYEKFIELIWKIIQREKQIAMGDSGSYGGLCHSGGRVCLFAEGAGGEQRI
jgi:hypothetical protein